MSNDTVRYPLRKIVLVQRVDPMQRRPLNVMLECGHTFVTYGGAVNRRRCMQCLLGERGLRVTIGDGAVYVSE